MDPYPHVGGVLRVILEQHERKAGQYDATIASVQLIRTMTAYALNTPE